MAKENYELTKMVRMPRIKKSNTEWLESISRNKTETNTELLQRKKLFEKISEIESNFDIKNKKGG